jgi:hypothetical protein
MEGSGCGPIAATNVIYYYAQQLNDDSARQQISGGLQGTAGQPTQAQYMQMAFRMYNDYTRQTSIQGSGIWFIDKVYDGIIKFAQKRGVLLKKHILTNKALAPGNSFRRAANFITEGLKNNYPVILLITLNKHIATLDSADATTDTSIMAERHFVAITAISRRMDSDEEDYELTISNYAGRKIIESLKKMWEGTPDWFDGAQMTIAAATAMATIATTMVASSTQKKGKTPDGVDSALVATAFADVIAQVPLSFASVSLGYCSFR